jgi:mxaJ protein
MILMVTAWLVSAAASGQEEGGWDMRVCADPNNLPYSNRAEEGYENRIAEILADQLEARLSYVWYPQRQLQIREVFREGECDLIMGVPDGNPLVLTSLPYYQSTYAFVYKSDAPFEIDSLDDPDLNDLRIGAQVPGGDGTATPPIEYLISRGLGRNLVGFSIFGDYSQPSPLRPIVDAVVNDSIDVAVVWGPIGGYFGNLEEPPLEVVPVTPQIVSTPTFLPMVFSLSIATRQGDEDLADLLDRAIIARWEDIQAVLNDYHVPLVPLAKPSL